MKSIRLGAGSAYWGDLLEPAIEVAEKGEVDYLCFDHLSELTLAVLQRQKARDPNEGYIHDIEPWTEAVLPHAMRQGFKIITNAGGANPAAAAAKVIEVGRRLGIANLKVAVVTGDDIFLDLDELRSEGVTFANMETGEANFDRIRGDIIAANAYIGGEGIAAGLAEGADVVVTGRVSDTALFVGPMMHEFGWTHSPEYAQQLGAAVTIGHVVECAALANGAVSNLWRDANNAWRIGFPIAEVSEDTTAVITKVAGSGGVLNEWTIKEQLVYEISDPGNVYMPDGIADFTRLRVEEVGPERVQLSAMTGKGLPDNLKVCIGYRDGWVGEGTLLFSWPDALEKARRGEQIIRKRLELLGVEPLELEFGYLGVNALHGPAAPEPGEMNEVGLRVAGKCRTREDAEAIKREATHLWTLGGIGTGYSSPAQPRGSVALWPTLVPRKYFQINTTVIVGEPTE
jgi:Acyclic terpene utilisation family protein AtuA